MMESRIINLDNFFALTKDKKIIKSLNFFVLSQEAKLKSVWGPTLTPLIGKDKITEFCNSFNKESSLLFDNDVYIPVFFLVYDNKIFNYIFRTPSIFAILKYIFDFDKLYFKKGSKLIYYITFEEIYFILSIKYSLYLYRHNIICLKDIFSILHNFNIKIIK